MTIYVNWEKRKILTEEQYVEETNARATRIFENGDYADYLNKICSATDIVLIVLEGAIDDIEKLVKGTCVKLANDEMEKEFADEITIGENEDDDEDDEEDEEDDEDFNE